MLRAIAIFALFFPPFLLGQECCQEKIDDEVPCVAKIDVGPAYIHIDVLKSGKTDHTVDLAAVKADFNYRFLDYFLVKPTLLYGHGQHKNMLFNGGAGLGFYIPLHKNFVITPMGGVIFGYLRTNLDIKIPISQNPPLTAIVHTTERFRSCSPFLSVEASWTFVPSWRIVVCYQYSWSRTRTKIKPFVNDKSHSEGSSYSALLEYDLNKHWSINVGAAYNVALTKEKHGLRAYGFKLGIAYWF